MSKIFWDSAIDTKRLEGEINKIARNSEEKHELWALVDEIIHHRVLGCILDKLPHEHHKEFLDEFSKRPYDEDLWQILKTKALHDIEVFIVKEVRDLADEILSYIEPRED